MAGSTTKGSAGLHRLVALLDAEAFCVPDPGGLACDFEQAVWWPHHRMTLTRQYKGAPRCIISAFSCHRRTPLSK
jgi:hypothetical protein